MLLPGRYDLELYDGNTFKGPEFRLPDLAAFDGPSALGEGVQVRAQVRPKAEAPEYRDLTVQVIDPVARTVRLRATATEVLALPKKGVWDLEVVRDDFVGTVLAGNFKKTPQVTR